MLYSEHNHRLHAFANIILVLFAVSFATTNAGQSTPSPSELSILGTKRFLGNDSHTIFPSNADSLMDTPEDDWRQSLPPELRNRNGAPLHRIELHGAVIYLLGTSHVSRTSCDDARLLMQHVRPDALFVELCAQRVGLLLSPPGTTTSNSEQQIKQQDDQNRGYSLSHRGAMMYSKIQADYAKKLNVTIGGEFREAFNSALSQQSRYWESQSMGMHNKFRQEWSSSSIVSHDSVSISHPRGDRQCAIILGDRPVSITLVRAWESLRLLGKLKLMIALVWSSIRQPSEKEIREWIESILNDRSGKNDLLTKAMEELGKSFPTLKRVIIEERDEFMVAKLIQTAEAMSLNNNHRGDKVIVAVVGAGHCPGMLEKLVDRYALDMVEEHSRPDRILPDLVKTKKMIASDDDLTSLVTDIVMFDYSYVLDSELQPEQTIE